MILMLTIKTLNLFCENHGIIINVLVSSFRFIWISMLLVYGQYKYFYFYSAGIDLNVYPRAVKVIIIDMITILILLVILRYFKIYPIKSRVVTLIYRLFDYIYG